MLQKYGLAFYKIGEILSGLGSIAFISKSAEETPPTIIDGLPKEMAQRFREQDEEFRARREKRLKTSSHLAEHLDQEGHWIANI